MDNLSTAPCPSCGVSLPVAAPGARRPVPAACPACGARRAPRIGVRALRWLALVLAAAGLLALRQAALARELPVTPIGQVDATMNMAYVRVQGRVIRPPSYDPAAESLSFWLDDGTGTLRAGAYRSVAQALVAGGRVPQAGDQVDLAGSLRVRAPGEYLSLTVNVPEHVHVDRPEARAVPLAGLSADDALERVQVRARVVSVRTPVAGLRIVTLRDASGRLDLAVPDDAVALGGPLPALEAGDSLAVTATVTLYNGGPQLSLGDTRDLARLPAGSVLPPEAALASLATPEAGRWVRVRGTASALLPFSSGARFTLEQDGTAVTVVLWQDVADGLAVPPAAGAQVELLAVVAEYHGRPELVPDLPDDVVVIAPAAAPAPGATVPPASPAPTSRVTAVPASPTRVPSGPTATPDIEESSTPAATTTRPGASTTPLPQGTSSPGASSTPAPGTRTPAPGPLTPISALIVGQTATVAGRVVDASSFAGGFKFVLDDGTGRVILLVWQDDYAFVPGAAGLRPGALVHATGLVQSYEGALELVPDGGRDVAVVEPGDGPAVTVRAIHSITGADVNTWQAVVGQVVNVRPFSTGVRVYLDDGSGSIAVVLWRTVWESLSTREAIVPGATVQVVGLVDVYREQVELVPALPVYVEVR